MRSDKVPSDASLSSRYARARARTTSLLTAGASRSSSPALRNPCGRDAARAPSPYASAPSPRSASSQESWKRRNRTRGMVLPPVRRPTDQLKDAGLSTSTANRYEQLASPSEQAAPAVDETPETVSASRQDRVKDRRSEVFPDGLR